jgi:hypothetical protein
MALVSVCRGGAGGLVTEFCVVGYFFGVRIIEYDT